MPHSLRFENSELGRASIVEYMMMFCYFNTHRTPLPIETRCAQAEDWVFNECHRTYLGNKDHCEVLTWNGVYVFCKSARLDFPICSDIQYTDIDINTFHPMPPPPNIPPDTHTNPTPIVAPITNNVSFILLLSGFIGGSIVTMIAFCLLYKYRIKNRVKSSKKKNIAYLGPKNSAVLLSTPESSPH